MSTTDTDMLRVGPHDFPAEVEITVYRIDFPAGHYLGRRDHPTTRYMLRPYAPQHRIPEPLDEQVLCRPVRVQHTRVLDGGPGQPTLIHATPARVLLMLDIGEYDITAE